MGTKLAIDDRLVEEARKLGRHKTNEAAVTRALEEYIKYQKRLAGTKLFGKIDFDPRHDYKAARRRR